MDFEPDEHDEQQHPGVELEEVDGFACPIDPAEAMLCDSCQ